MPARKAPASCSEGYTTRLAYSYVRVSDPTQAKAGKVGIDRQEQSFGPFCTRHGLTPVEEALVDRGRSAFHGTHQKKGALGKFIEAAEAGLIPEGSVLVVDDLSRFSRETTSRAEELLHRLWNAGCALGVVAVLDKVVTREAYDKEPNISLTLGVVRSQVNLESAEKARKIADVWAQRRKKWEEHGTPYLGSGSRPFWLSDDGTNFTVDKDAAKTIRLIFRLSAEENMGGSQIAKHLKDVGIRGARGGAFTAPRVNKVLTDQRVIGEKVWPGGDVAKGYFPRIVDQELWEKNAAARGRRDDNKGRAGRSTVVNNILAGTVYCACRAPMTFGQSSQRVRTKRGKSYPYLRCTARRDGNCNQPPGDLRYDEEFLLLALMGEKWSKLLHKPKTSKELRAAEKKIRDLQAVADSMSTAASNAEASLEQTMTSPGFDPGQLDMLSKIAIQARKKHEQAEEDLTKAQSALTQLKLQPTGENTQREIVERVEQFLRAGRHDVEERKRFNNWWQSLGLRVTVVDPKAPRLQWGSNTAYLDSKGQVISDSSLEDMEALGLPPEAVAARAAQIEGEFARRNQPEPDLPDETTSVRVTPTAEQAERLVEALTQASHAAPCASAGSTRA